MSKIIPQLLLFCIATLCDWLKKLTPLPRPIRSKTKTNPDLLARVFPAFGTGDMYLLRALIGSLDCSRLLRLVRVITLVFVLRHSNENRSNIFTKVCDNIRLSSVTNLILTGALSQLKYRVFIIMAKSFL